MPKELLLLKEINPKDAHIDSFKTTKKPAFFQPMYKEEEKGWYRVVPRLFIDNSKLVYSTTNSFYFLTGESPYPIFEETGYLLYGELSAQALTAYNGPNGPYYKDYFAFHKSHADICYVPSRIFSDMGTVIPLPMNREFGYSYTDIFKMVYAVSKEYIIEDLEEFTEEVFERLTWQYPETVIDEQIEFLKRKDDE